MGKKYQPSGYQIITLEKTGVGLVKNEDYHILFDILSSGKLPTKPILLTVLAKESGYYDMLGFAIWRDPGELCLNYNLNTGDIVTYTLSINDDELKLEIHES